MARVTHFEILADDPQRLTEFYRDVFGWHINSWSGPQGYWLATTGADGTPGINGGFMHRHFKQPVINTIQVDSLDDALSTIQSHGGKLFHGPTDIPGVGRHAYCADPEGNLFGIIQPAQ